MNKPVTMVTVINHEILLTSNNIIMISDTAIIQTPKSSVTIATDSIDKSYHSNIHETIHKSLKSQYLDTDPTGF